MIKNEKGFSVVEVLVVAVIVGLVGAVGWLVFDRQKSSDDQTPTTSTTQQTDSSTVTQSTKPLLAGDFGSGGNYGTFQAEGYAKTLKELYDVSGDCGMSNPGVDCTKIDGVYFIITTTPNDKVLPYIKNLDTGQPANSIVMGCPVDGTIKYSNMSDIGSKEYVINKDDTARIMASTVEKPISLEISKQKQSFGKDAPSCYSDFTTYKIIE